MLKSWQEVQFEGDSKPQSLMKTGDRPNLGAGLGDHMGGRRLDLAGQRALHRKVADDDAVARVLAPGVEQLPRQPALQHGRRGQHDAGPAVIQAPPAAHLRHIAQLEGIVRRLRSQA